MKKNKKQTIDIKAEVHGAEPGVDQLVNIDTSEYTEEDLSELITTRIDALNDLEKHILEAEEAADAAIKEADDVKNGIIDYGIFWDSIDTDKAIEKLQNAVISTAKALEESSDAHKKTFEYQKRLTNISYGLFRLGATNIAHNRSLVREIELRLKGASEKEISELARNELVRVVTQLKEQEDLQKKLARLKEEVKVLKKSQKDINDSLTVLDTDKNILDQKTEEVIKQLLDYRALLEDNIERTEQILCQVDLNETNFKNIFNELDSKIDDQNNNNKISIDNNKSMILDLKDVLDKYQAQFTLLVKEVNDNKASNDKNRSMILELKDELNRHQELFSIQTLSVNNNITSKASKSSFYILAALLIINIIVSIVVFYK